MAERRFDGRCLAGIGSQYHRKTGDQTTITYPITSIRPRRGKGRYCFDKQNVPFPASAGTDEELFDAYRRSYKELPDIRVDVRSPDGSTVLGKNLTLEEAVTLLEKYLPE